MISEHCETEEEKEENQSNLQADSVVMSHQVMSSLSKRIKRKDVISIQMTIQIGNFCSMITL